MTPLLKVADVQRAEQALIDSGVSEAELMVQAGAGVSSLIENVLIPGANVVILCGPGKNGGDGLVVGSELVDVGLLVSIWCWERDGIAGAPVVNGNDSSFEWLESLDSLAESLEAADIVIDAVFGAGGRAELPKPVIEAFDIVKREQEARHIEIFALDLPSGMSADTGEIAESALHADHTAMIGLPKIGAFMLPAAAHTGRIHLVDIGLEVPEGIDDDAPRLISRAMIRRILPVRRTGTHKRAAGTAMIIGGAPNYYGAPRLAGEAALRAGAGLVSVAAPSSIIGTIATAVPELTFVPLPVAGHLTAAGKMASLVREELSRTDALVIGPGLGTDDPVPEFLAQLLGFNQASRSGIGFGTHADPDPVEPFAGKAVLDADALNWLAKRDAWWDVMNQAELVLTPHPGELARLLGVEREQIEGDPWGKAIEAARRFGQVVVLKYAYSVVATPDGRLFVAPAAPVGLASAGTGDVLSGIIGALLAQGCSSEQAAVGGVGIGTYAADLAAIINGGPIGFTASDLIIQIPAARQNIMRFAGWEI